MMFSHPWVLFLLAFPAAALIWTWQRAGHRVVLPTDHGQRGAGRVLFAAAGIAESLAPLLLAVAIILLAGPQRLGEPETKRVLTNISFCVDVSYSMTSQFGEGSRYDGSMKCINEFAHYRKGDAFGLSFFGNAVLHWCPLTTDISAITCSLPFMRPETAPSWFNGTEIGKALRACAKVLKTREQGDRMIVLITDGFSADLWGGKDLEIAEELKRDGVVVFGIIVGDSRVPDEIVNISRLTGGEMFDAGDPEALKFVFRRIDQMQPVKVEKTIAETKDDFQPWCFAGLVLVGLSSLTQFGLRYTPW